MFNFFKSTPKKYQDLNAQDFLAGMKGADAVIIDVRMPGEFASEKIPGARNINVMGSFKKSIENLPRDKSYYLYCRSGSRSGQACSIMADMGFEKVTNLKGGIMSWPFETA
ncbi:rhodanese-like domain-containing protein [Algoriphagus namhaensis]|uniref:Rhodanese-like domain-containing protein n=1 Tax=Algoriphagus namhaensis TaxID=915353 RepID=A0ABV8AXS4_9BACT